MAEDNAAIISAPPGVTLVELARAAAPVPDDGPVPESRRPGGRLVHRCHAGHVRAVRAIGMRVVAWTFTPSPERAAALGVEFVELDDLLAQSDVISLHTKLTDDSRGMIGARELGLMKRGAILVNAGRGPLVNEEALVASLESGHLGGAGLDVFTKEPLPHDAPTLRCKQVVLTPHNADSTPEGMHFLNLNEGAVDNAIAFLEGQPQNVVT
jgi:phosphoglycerate dehydrogenase-like enzyme